MTGLLLRIFLGLSLFVVGAEVWSTGSEEHFFPVIVGLTLMCGAVVVFASIKEMGR